MEMDAKVIQIFAFLMIVNSALALTCYKCDSSDSGLCKYGVGSFALNTVDCNEEAGGGVLTDWVPKQCVKLVAKSKDGSQHIARGCMPKVGGACSGIAKALSVFTSLEGEIEEMDCFPCDGDKCNSATKFTGYTFLGVILAALAFMFI